MPWAHISTLMYIKQTPVVKHPIAQLSKNFVSENIFGINPTINCNKKELFKKNFMHTSGTCQQQTARHLHGSRRISSVARRDTCWPRAHVKVIGDPPLSSPPSSSPPLSPLLSRSTPSPSTTEIPAAAGRTSDLASPRLSSEAFRWFSEVGGSELGRVWRLP